jgi:hypothetical protein
MILPPEPGVIAQAGSPVAEMKDPMMFNMKFPFGSGEYRSASELYQMVGGPSSMLACLLFPINRHCRKKQGVC